MNTKPVRFMNAVVLSILFFITIFSLIGVERGSGSVWTSVHSWAGGLMLFGSAGHLLTHMDWVKAVFSRPAKTLPQTARRNRRTDLGLFVTGSICAVTGLAGVIGPAERLSRVHEMSGMFMILLVFLHLALHWRWMVDTIRQLFASRPAKPVPSLFTR